jgi:hypothetical protein
MEHFVDSLRWNFVATIELNISIEGYRIAIKTDYETEKFDERTGARLLDHYHSAVGRSFKSNRLAFK